MPVTNSGVAVAPRLVIDIIRSIGLPSSRMPRMLIFQQQRQRHDDQESDHGQDKRITDSGE